ncbi:MAG: YitT family protein [Bacilli bacterium]|nr:YitT family protein [Bacilli bacterium]
MEKASSRIKILKDIAYIVLAAIAGAVAIHIFAKNANFAPAGCDGIAQMLSEATNLSFYIWSLIINLPLIVVGYIFLKKKYVLYTLLYIGLNALAVFILETTNCPSIPVVITVGSETITDTGMRFVCTIFTGLLLGLRTGFMLKIGASSGGVDIPACIIGKKMKGFNVEVIITGFSLVIIGSSYFLYHDFISILLSIIEMLVLTLSAAYAQKDLRHAVECKIITKHPDEVKQIIMNKFRHGVTIVEAKGGWTDKESEILFTVIGIRELSAFLNLIATIPDTFTYYNEIDGLLGNFRWRREDVAK